MKGYLLVLIICHMLAISLSDSVIEGNNKSAVTEKETFSEHRRKLLIFPKNTVKFIMTSKPHVSTASNYSLKEKAMTRMPIMHLTMKPKSKVITTHSTSRKPLMKLRTFTVKSHENENRKTAQRTRKNPTNPMDISRTSPMPLSENDVTEFYLPEESQIHLERLPFSDKTDEKDRQNNIYEKDGSYSKDNNDNNSSSDEEQDRNEFIFLENRDKKLAINDFLGNTDQDYENSFETTTEFTLSEKELRVKRSDNIIVEENLASTTSGLKYTGQNTRLSNDVYFKNINS